MKRLLMVLLLALAAAWGCERRDLKKEAYEKGLADGEAAARAKQISAARSATPPPGPRTQLDSVQKATPEAAVRRILPNSKLQGTALDQKPKR